MWLVIKQLLLCVIFGSAHLGDWTLELTGFLLRRWDAPPPLGLGCWSIPWVGLRSTYRRIALASGLTTFWEPIPVMFLSLAPLWHVLHLLLHQQRACPHRAPFGSRVSRYVAQCWGGESEFGPSIEPLFG